MTNKPVAVNVPQEIVNDETVTLVSWLAEDKAKVEAGQTIAEIETSKMVLEIAASVSGYIRYAHEKGANVPVGGILCHITAGPSDPLPAASRPPAALAASVPATGNGTSADTRFSRKAEAMIRENGLDPKQFAGRGLVREGDVLDFLKARSSHGAPETKARGTADGRPAAGTGSVKRQPVSKLKQAEIKILSNGANALRSSVTVACPTRGWRAVAELHPETGGLSAIIIHEAARLLRKYPFFNAYFDDDHVNLYESVNIGIAVDAGKGLKVVVLHQADDKPLGAIAKEFQDLLLSYYENKIPAESFTGGTFTISDLSGEGVYAFEPLINQGQAAILGVCAEFFPPGSREGILQFVLSFDHRVAEGRMAAQFLGDLRDRVMSHERALRSSKGMDS